MAREQESRPERVKKMQFFLNDAYTDYIAARVLLLRGLLKQATVVASTAIEKCAKVVLAQRGVNVQRDHLNQSHWKALEKEENFGKKLNRDFVELTQSAYELRYSDSLAIGFNLVVASREFLAELDHTLLTVLSCYKFDVNQSWRPSGYETALRQRDENLLAENHMLSGQPPGMFVNARPQFVYEVRRHQMGLFEAIYMTDRPPRRPGFRRVGLVLRGTGFNVVDLSHFPTSGTFLLLLDGLERFGSESSAS